MISVENINKTFKLYSSPADRLKEIVMRRSFHKNYTALHDITFDVQPGETLGIIGQNGAGKSTLLKILTGILIPDSGSIQIEGRITGLLELGTGFNHEFSGIDNIYFNGTYLGLSRQEINDRLDTIVEFTELGDFIYEPMKTYSSGMIMRLAFSVAIHADPSAFVVDEALSVGDAYFQQKCIRKIKEFKKNGGSIVFVSHDMNAVKVLCDKAMLLEQGECIETGSPESIVNSYNFLIARRSSGEEIVLRRSREGERSAFGNNKISIDSIQMLDHDGNMVNILQTGSPAQMEIWITGQENLDDVTVGIMIRDKFGQDIFGTNTYHLACPLQVQKGKRYKIIYNFDELNIGPGKYSLTVAAHPSFEHTDECYNWIDKVMSFEIVGDINYLFAGIVRMKPMVSIETI